MKLRSVVLFAAGVATGLAIARKLSEDDDPIVHGPQQAQSGNPTLRVHLGPDRDALRSAPPCAASMRSGEHGSRSATGWVSRATTKPPGADLPGRLHDDTEAPFAALQSAHVAPAISPYRVSWGGSSRMKKQFPDFENAAMVSTPPAVSPLTWSASVLDVAPATH